MGILFKNILTKKMKLLAIILGLISAEPIVRDEGCVVGCMVRFGNQMTKCEELEEAEEFRCVTGAMKDVFRCMADCLSKDVSPVVQEVFEIPEVKDEGCVVGCMVKFGNQMEKCEQLEEQEEFRCVTGAMRDVFRCMGNCLAKKLSLQREIAKPAISESAQILIKCFAKMFTGMEQCDQMENPEIGEQGKCFVNVLQNAIYCLEDGSGLF